MSEPSSQRHAERLSRAEQYERAANELLMRSGWLAPLRAVLFLAMVVAGFCGWLIIGAGPVGFTLCGIFFVVLVAVVMKHERLQRDVIELRTRAHIQKQAAARITRDWDQLPKWRIQPPDEMRAVSRDLDLLGHTSLFRWLCEAHTPSGIRTIRDWLMTPAPPDEIRERQAAVQTLRDLPELCDEIGVAGSLLAQGLSDPDQFLEWLESKGWYHNRRQLLMLARTLSIGFLIVLLMFIFRIASRDVLGVIGLLIVGVNVILSVSFTGSMHDVFFQVTTPSGEMQRYRELFGLMSRLPQEQPRLAKLRDIVTDIEHGAERQLKSLQNIMDLANLRRSGIFGAIYLLLQITVLWDFHVMTLLERWRVAFCKDARRWFDALGELEALASLAAAARNHPDWVFPSVDGSIEKLEAQQLGHPLLPPESCVRNDVEVGPQGAVLLVTGSNMSGKSTLLRSLGLNSVLAHAGGPVCATEYASPPLVVATSMRIVDSLDDGVSFFMAELKRLKEIVDQADGFRADDGPMLLYLLDEILQGTNSAERRIAVARVVAHLLQRRSIGAISTHDLELAGEPLLAKACRPVHFRESFEETEQGRRMTFDYQMHQGVAPTTNALVLLEMVGLNESPET